MSAPVVSERVGDAQDDVAGAKQGLELVLGRGEADHLVDWAAALALVGGQVFGLRELADGFGNEIEVLTGGQAEALCSRVDALLDVVVGLAHLAGGDRDRCDAFEPCSSVGVHGSGRVGDAAAEAGPVLCECGVDGRCEDFSEVFFGLAYAPLGRLAHAFVELLTMGGPSGHEALEELPLGGTDAGLQLVDLLLAGSEFVGAAEVDGVEAFDHQGVGCADAVAQGDAEQVGADDAGVGGLPFPLVEVDVVLGEEALQVSDGEVAPLEGAVRAESVDEHAGDPVWSWSR